MPKDYKDSLLLPKTEFKMRGNLGETEKIRQSKWEDIKLYKNRLLKNKDNKPFYLHDGPPYANGNIHAGHALNKILKDFIIRYKNMNGFYAPYRPGWDTHGLPIETELKKRKITPQNMKKEDFLNECKNYALEQVQKQKEQFKRLGVLGEFDKPYLTLDPKYEGKEIEVFAKLVEMGLIYRGLKPVYWSYSNQTALAEAEIVYENVDTDSIFVKFLIKDNKNIKDLENAYLVIWTTTPWTLPADLAVCANKDITYSLYDTSLGKLLVSKNLKDKLFEKFNLDKSTHLKDFKGSEIEKITYIHPLYSDKICPVILGDHVSDSDGTGLVHTAPGHGVDDYIVGVKNGIEIFSPIDSNGYLTDEAREFKGLFYEDANKKIIEYLEKEKTLIKISKINHAYPHDWRSHKPIIFRATPQWFCNISGVLDKIRKAIDDVKFVPEWGKNRLKSMMENRTDWCISRQRSWGVPIPILYDKNDNPILDKDVILEISKKISKNGSSFWYSASISDLISAKSFKKYQPVRKEVDTLDVWFDSGTSFLTLEGKEINLYLEGSDQYRGWFNSSLINGVCFLNKAPFKEVVSHGFILDQKGQKMSKSLGNVVDPISVSNKFGADVLRVWVALTDYKSDVPLSPELLNQASDSYRKIRNTFKYLLGNLSDFNYETDYISFSMRNNLDKVMTIKLNELVKDVLKYYESYDFEKIYRKIMPYITNDLSSFYLDMAKDSIYVLSKNDRKRRSMQSVMYDNLIKLLTLLTPIIPHTTSEAYEYLAFKKEKDIYLLNMPNIEKYPKESEYLMLYDDFYTLRGYILKEIENMRNLGKIKKSLESDVKIYAPKKYLESISKLKLDLNDVLMIAKAEVFESDAIKIIVDKSNGMACARCWNYYDNLNSDDLCKRCVKILKEKENEK